MANKNDQSFIERGEAFNHSVIEAMMAPINERPTDIVVVAYIQEKMYVPEYSEL